MAGVRRNRIQFFKQLIDFKTSIYELLVITRDFHNDIKILESKIISNNDDSKIIYSDRIFIEE